jgi:ribose transport system permease protein
VRTSQLKSALNEQRIFLLILGLSVYLSLSSRYFLTFLNITNILLAISFEGMIAIGMALLIIVGEIDLSVGSLMAFGAVLSIMFQPYGVLVGMITGILGGVLFGFVNGLLVTKIRLPSIAATLGVMVLVKGVVFALTREHTALGTNKGFVLLSQTNVFGIPMPVIVFVCLLVIFELILQKSLLGRRIFAVGGNATASRFFGIKTDRTKIFCFVATGFLAGLAGVMLASKLNIASGNIGQYSNVLVITAVLLGGISMDGGEGSIFKAFQGILLLGIINNAMVIMRISPFVQEIIQGALLIFIVVIDSISIARKRYK